MIAEVNVSSNTLREYVWLLETEIAPTRQGRAQVDRPIAAITGVNTASPATLYVHVDHLNRPVSMTNASKASVWDAVWTPWGAPYSIIGSETLDARFPGQWFQLEAGLNYNWHRHYDPTTGRYTQPDPLGFVDGPSVYSYVKNEPHGNADPSGQQVAIPVPPILWPIIPPAMWCAANLEKCQQVLKQCYRAIAGSGAGDNEDERCKKVISGCVTQCKQIYVDDPDALPGSGKNYQPRYVRCVKECAKSQGCDY